MTPKEKALQLYKKYSKGKDEHGWFLCEFDSCAKQCALIAVDEILDATTGMVDEDNNYSSDNYWNEVKQEINNLLIQKEKTMKKETLEEDAEIVVNEIYYCPNCQGMGCPYCFGFGTI